MNRYEVTANGQRFVRTDSRVVVNKAINALLTKESGTVTVTNLTTGQVETFTERRTRTRTLHEAAS